MKAVKPVMEMPRKAKSMKVPQIPNRSVERNRSVEPIRKGIAKSGIKALGRIAALKEMTKKSK